MTVVEQIKQIIKKNIYDADCGIYNCPNIVGDSMTRLYSKDGVTVDICYGYSYFEVLGLSTEDFKKVKEYYNRIR